ncbi:DUF6009 family protein [Streptomyces sp. NPDC017943]|uniref:DUF6009 family protein n=1 Tax=Streptomyces TaxID=1883 RepID=UPI00345116A4
MSSLMNEGQLVYERRVVWLECPDGLDYVRQTLDKGPRRTGRPRYARDGRLVGYAELAPDAEACPDSGFYRRRIFFLLPHDRPNEPDGPYRVGAPGEAVDPRTVRPGRVGCKTSRSQDGGNGCAVTQPLAFG